MPSAGESSLLFAVSSWALGQASLLNTGAIEGSLLNYRAATTLDWALATRGGSATYSGSVSPEPPSSVGKSLSFGSPSFMGSTVDS
jgi:hypothetical protein